MNLKAFDKCKFVVIDFEHDSDWIWNNIVIKREELERYIKDYIVLDIRTFRKDS